MSYLDTFVPSKRSIENPNIPLNDPGAWEELGLSTGRTKSGVRVTHKKALGHSPVWRGVNLIARTVARMRPIIYRNDSHGGRARDNKHIGYSMLRRKANNFVTSGTFLKTLTYHAVFYGNGYALIQKDQAGRIAAVAKGGGLIILSPFDTYPVQKDGQVIYRTVLNGRQEFITAEDILHIKGLSFDGLCGHSVIQVLAEALSVGISARDYAARFFGQGANASGILMIPGTLKPEAQKQAIKDFEAIVSGAANQHRVGVLQDKVKWQPLSVNPEQSQMLQEQDFDLRVVANVLSLPPHKLGDVTRQGYASLEQENQSFLDDSIDPWLNTWEEELEDKLLTDAEKENETHFIEFNRNALLKTDAMTRARFYATAKQWGWMTTNDILRKENEEPVGPEGDVLWAPGNMVPIDQLGKDKSATAQMPAPDAGDDMNNGQGANQGTDLTPDQNVDATREAVFDAVVERLSHLTEIENEHVKRAAKRESNFVTWLESYYGERLATYDEVLQPLVRVWATTAGRTAPAFLRGVTMELSHRLVDQARQELLTIAGRCTQAELAGALDSFGAGRDEQSLRFLVTETLGV